MLTLRSFRDRGWSQIWCQNREFADLFPLHRAAQVGVIHHPNLGYDFADQLSMTEKPHHRTLRNHNTHRVSDSTHVGCGNVPAAESQRYIHLCGHGIEVAARGKDNSFPADDEPAIQLRQFLDGSAKIEISDVE